VTIGTPACAPIGSAGIGELHDRLEVDLVVEQFCELRRRQELYDALLPFPKRTIVAGFQ
jgi:hypothetical protein